MFLVVWGTPPELLARPPSLEIALLPHPITRPLEVSGITLVGHGTVPAVDQSTDSPRGLVHTVGGLSASIPPQTYHTAAMQQD